MIVSRVLLSGKPGAPAFFDGVEALEGVVEVDSKW
jgi:hypothetical protein